MFFARYGSKILWAFQIVVGFLCFMRQMFDTLVIEPLLALRQQGIALLDGAKLVQTIRLMTAIACVMLVVMTVAVSADPTGLAANIVWGNWFDSELGMWVWGWIEEGLLALLNGG